MSINPYEAPKVDGPYLKRKHLPSKFSEIFVDAFLGFSMVLLPYIILFGGFYLMQLIHPL
jgi:hypothetical protein